VRVELRRTAHGLAGVVDDEIEAIAGGDELVAERLDARRVPQVEPEDFQSIGPFAEVGFLGVTLGRVARSRTPQLEVA